MNTSPPVFSICIANYNGETMLVDCLESVFTQTTREPIEIIVHDDASTDASLDVLSRYPQVVTIPSRENAGFCIANNRMVARATGEFVLLLNNDAALFPDALDAMLKSMRAQPDVGILTLPQYDWETGELVDRGCLLDPFYNPVPNLDTGRQDVAYVIGACLFMPRTLWNALGGFPEWIESIGEDLYLCSLARLRNLKVCAVAESGYRHQQGASFGGNRVDRGRLSTTFRRRRLSERNKTAVMMICTPGPNVWPLLAMHLALLGLEGIAMTLWRRDTRIWREIYAPALRSVVADWDLLKTRRRAVQSTRTATLRSYLRAFVLVPRKLSMLRRYGVPRIN